MRVRKFNHKFPRIAGMALALLLTLAAPVLPLGLESAGVITPSGTGAGFLNPAGFWYDTLRGFLVVANTHARQIVVLNRQGQALKVLGKEGELGFPVAVTGDGDGTLYIAERNSESLKVVPRYDTEVEGEFRTFDLIPYRRSAPVQPVALHIDRQGSLYVADRGNRQVLAFDRDGKLKLTIPDVGEPSDLWVDRAGKILVADPGFGGIRVYSEKGMPLRTLGGRYSAQTREPLRVRGLAADRMGRIWVVEETGQGIKTIDSLGNLLLNFTSGISFPVDLAIDDQDNLFVLEQGGNRISVFRIVGF